jgi:sulfur-carrier protein
VAVVWIPSLLQSLTGGDDKVMVSGATVAQIIENLETRFPGVKDRLVHEGELRPHIAVAIDGDVSPEGLEQDVQESSEIHFIPALSGGVDAVPAHAPPSSWLWLCRPAATVPAPPSACQALQQVLAPLGWHIHTAFIERVN